MNLHQSPLESVLKSTVAPASGSADAHFELSTLLKDQREWSGSLEAVENAILLMNGNAAFHARQLDLLMKLGRVNDAKMTFDGLPPSVRSDPVMIPFRVTLCNLAGHFETGRLLLNEAVWSNLRSRASNLALIDQWLTSQISSGEDWSEFPQRVQKLAAVRHDDRRYHGLLATYQMIHAWLDGSHAEVLRISDRHRDFLVLPDIDEDRSVRVFHRYVRLLALARRNGAIECVSTRRTLYVLGESHCLSPANTVFEWEDGLIRAKGLFVLGIQMKHLAKAAENTYQRNMRGHLDRLPLEPLLLTIGEIDCRPVEGMWGAASKCGTPVSDLALANVHGYLSFLDDALGRRTWPSITLQGVPAPGYDLTDRRDPGDKQGFIEMIRFVNHLLEAGARKRGWSFLDIHSATANDEGMGNGRWHMDRYHVAPSFYEQSAKWRITPH